MNGNGHHGGIDLAAAIVESLDNAGLARLAERLAPWLEPYLTELEPAGWLNPSGAAEYMGVKTRRVYDLKSMGVLVPDGFDGRTPLWRRETLDAYLRSRS